MSWQETGNGEHCACVNSRQGTCADAVWNRHGHAPVCARMSGRARPHPQIVSASSSLHIVHFTLLGLLDLGRHISDNGFGTQQARVRCPVARSRDQRTEAGVDLCLYSMRYTNLQGRLLGFECRLLSNQIVFDDDMLVVTECRLLSIKSQ